MIRAKILNASAGSGKTYQLAYKYIRDVVERPELYRAILAVTFTNKATEEMKSRILRELHALSNGSPSGYLADLCRELGMDERSVRKRASEAQTRILHDYSRFTVLTIDRFFQRIVRAFIKELGIDLDYNIELETDSILARSADALIEEILEDKQLERWLMNYVEERFDEGSRWNVRDDILSLGAEIFRERSKDMIQLRQTKEELQRTVSAMLARSQQTKRQLAECAADMRERIASAGVDPSDFKGKGRSFVYSALRYADGRIVEPTATIRKAAADINAWCGKESPAAAKALAPELRERLEEICRLYDDNISHWNSTELIRENYRSFALLSDLYRKVTELCRAENIMVLNETKYVLSRFINGDNTPFIYEKIGNRYERFMIDEFQDTSVKEWENFLPLLQNAMAQSADISVLLVGDIKQSIYRWRGGDWRLLQSRAAESLGHDNTQIVPLTSNYRSLAAVVEFNNRIIRRIVDLDNRHLNALLDEAHAAGAINGETFAALRDTLLTAYEGHEQTPRKNDPRPGFVRVEIFDRDGDSPMTAVIEDAIARGYRYSDILVLVRDAKDGIRAARQLFEYKHARFGDKDGAGFNVMTQDALTISRSRAVSFVVAVLRLSIDRRLSIERAIYNHYLGRDTAQELPAEELDFLAGASQLSPEEAFESIVMRYSLHEQRDQIAYLQAMHEQIISFCTNRIADIQLYLKWWDERGSDERLRVEKSDNTIEITTIHKAKGLEKPVVIIPYCNWKTIPETSKNPIVWAESGSNSPADEIGAFPVAYGKAMQRSAFSNEYYTELVYSHVDAVNLLYVALTRAADELYIFLPEKTDRRTASSESITAVVPLVVAALPEVEGMTASADGMVFTAGQRSQAPAATAKDETEETLLTEYPTSLPRLSISRRNERYFEQAEQAELAPRNYGILMHRIFENAAGSDDIVSAIEHMRLDGTLTAAQSIELQEKISAALDNPLSREWFEHDWETVRNESDIVIPGKSHLRRPDRVMIDGRRAVVVDYKFGSKRRKQHTAQVAEYVSLLEAMNRFDRVEGYIWYIAENEITEVRGKDA